MTLSDDVLFAFSISGTPQRLASGEGNYYLVENLVFKPVSFEEETVWRAKFVVAKSYAVSRN